MNAESRAGDAGKRRGQSDQGRIERLRPRGVDDETGAYIHLLALMQIHPATVSLSRAPSFIQHAEVDVAK